MTVIIHGLMKLKDFHLLELKMEFWYLEDAISNKFVKIKFGFNKKIFVIHSIKMKEVAIVILDI